MNKELDAVDIIALTIVFTASFIACFSVGMYWLERDKLINLGYEERPVTGSSATYWVAPEPEPTFRQLPLPSYKAHPHREDKEN